MTEQAYEIDGIVSKATEDVRLWQTGKGLVEISKDTLATSIVFGDRRSGYVFHGQGKLLLDAIVETEEGAVGRPVENELSGPFLMLGDTEGIQKNLAEANEEDLAGMGYGSPEKFIAEAEDLCNRFFKKGSHGHERFDGGDGLIFAFQDEASEFGILVAKGSKLVYTAKDLTFVSKGNKEVLKIPGEVVCNDNGKSVIIKKDGSIIIRK